MRGDHQQRTTRLRALAQPHCVAFRVDLDIGQAVRLQHLGIGFRAFGLLKGRCRNLGKRDDIRSEEHTSEFQSLMRISYAVFCLKKKKNIDNSYKYVNTKIEYTHMTNKQNEVEQS